MNSKSSLLRALSTAATLVLGLFPPASTLLAQTTVTLRIEQSRDFTAKVVDQFGNPIANSPETFAWQATGGSLSATSGATVTYVAGSSIGSNYYIRATSSPSAFSKQLDLALVAGIAAPTLNSVVRDADKKRFNLSWSLSTSTDVDRYQIQRRHDGTTTWTILSTVQATGLTGTQAYSDKTGLYPDQTVHYRVVALDDAFNDTAASNAITVATGSDFIRELNALVLVHDTNKTESNPLRDLLTAAGYTIIQQKNAPTTTEIANADLIASASGSGPLTAAVLNSNKPLIVLNRHDTQAYTKSFMASSLITFTDTSLKSLTIPDAARNHPIFATYLAANPTATSILMLSGTNTPHSNSRKLETNGLGKVLLTAENAPVIVLYNAGDTMPGTTTSAPGRRAAISWTADNYSKFTDDGKALLLNIIKWAAGEINDAAAPISPYLNWLTTRNVADPSQDEDGNGFAEILDYVFANDLVSPAIAAQPATLTMTEHVAVNGDTAYLQFEFRRRKNLTEIEYGLESSKDLVTWTEAPRDEVILDTSSEDYDVVALRVPKAGETKIFVRLVVSEGL